MECIKIALIPAYEPDENLIELVKKLKNNNYSIIVVNDGSNKSYDDIFLVVSKFSTVLKNEVNSGKGVALKKGLNYIKETYKSNYIVVTMDCDGQHTVEDADKLCEYSSNNRDVLVLGKRIRSNKTPLRSRIGNLFTRFIYKMVMNFDVYDTQTGLRAFTEKTIDFLINVDGNRYEYEMNVLLNCPSNNIKIKEIEIQTIYIDNNSNSHFNTFKDSFLIYKEIFKFSISSIFCFIIDYFLYSLIMIISSNLVVSNILARIVSSITNYTINKNIVFNSKKSISKSFTEYFLLAICILIFNTLCLSILVNVTSINVYLAKILTEIILFIFSWTIQNKVIFNR